MCVSLYSCLSYSVCKPHPSYIALYYNEGPVSLYHIFPYDLKSTILWKKVNEQKSVTKIMEENTQIVVLN